MFDYVRSMKPITPVVVVILEFEMYLVSNELYPVVFALSDEIPTFG
jgi:hypothetical protein